MESSEEKLEAIRQQARRRAAEQAQSEAAERRRAERKRSGVNFTWWHGLLSVAVIIAGIWTLIPDEKGSGSSDLDDLDKKAAVIREYKQSAFTIAALSHLRTQGVEVDDADSTSASRISDSLYALTFKTDGEAYRMRGEYICDEGFELMPDNMADPLCYRWQ